MKIILISFLFLFLGNSAALAAVPELGNCRDTQECHFYCEIPSNKPACWAYAQFRVLGDATPSASLVFPIAQLGNCTDKVACKAYCEVAEHHDVCADYARIHRLGKLTAAAELVENAKAALGCDSLTSCKAICEKAENKDKCKAFTLKFAPPVVQDRVKTAQTVIASIEQALGCTSLETCKQMCQLAANKSICNTALRPAAEMQEIERHKLNADCKTTDECRIWCQTHPLLCPALHTNTETHASEASSRSGTRL